MILCSGEALIDMLPRKTADGEECFAPHPGGAVMNTAIALGRLGAPAAFFSGISTDLFGRMLEDRLSESQVWTDLLHRTDRPTTLAFVELADGHATYHFYDENSAGRLLTPADLPALPAEIEACFFGGISIAVEPCGTAYQAMMERAAASCVTMIDPNVRPGFIADEAAFRDRVWAMLSMADIVKVSDEDLAWIMGPGDVTELAHALLAKGPALICVTEGAAGARGITREAEVFVPSKKVEVADTVGAGDTFNAGVLAALHRDGALTKARIRALDEDTIKAALRLGADAAAVTVSRAGANPPWDEELS